MIMTLKHETGSMTKHVTYRKFQSSTSRPIQPMHKEPFIPQIDLLPAKRVLMLDVDGPLQTSKLADFEDMEFVPLLVKLLAKAPDVRVVVSSTHREGRDHYSLLNFFPPALRPYIIGAIPVHPTGRADLGRQREIEEWLSNNRWVEDWRALDDELYLFERDHPNLIAVSPYFGLGDEYAVAQLTKWLTKA